MAEVNVRKASYNEDGSLSCEVNLVRFGWVPFTAREDDPNERGRKIYTLAKAMADGVDVLPDTGDKQLQPPSPAEILQEARFRRRVDKLELVRNLRALGVWQDFRDALADDALEDWEIAGSVSRLDPVFSKVLTGLGMTEEDQDIAFGMKSIR